MNIKVYGQMVSKFINGNDIFATNRYIDSFKKGFELKSGDEFLLDGVWYVSDNSKSLNFLARHFIENKFDKAELTK